jgi:hypothetical protein
MRVWLLGNRGHAEENGPEEVARVSRRTGNLRLANGVRPKLKSQVPACSVEQLGGISMKAISTVMMAACLFASACTYHVQQSQPLLDAGKVNGIQKGKTTRAEVEAILGPPANTAMAGQGKRLAYYGAYNISSTGHAGLFTAGTGAATVRSQNLQILYSASGVVEDYEFSDRTDNSNTRVGWGGMSVQSTTTPTGSK